MYPRDMYLFRWEQNPTGTTLTLIVPVPRHSRVLLRGDLPRLVTTVCFVRAQNGENIQTFEQVNGARNFYQLTEPLDP